MRCCWQELALDNEMRVFVVRDWGRATLIAPWMRSRGIRKRLPVRVLGFIEHPETQVADLLYADAGVEQALKTLLDYAVSEIASEWDLLMLDKIPVTSETNRWLQLIQASSKCKSELDYNHRACVIPLIGSWNEYLNRQSPRFRKTLRNIINRTQRLGTVEVKCYRGSEAAERGLQRLFSVSNSSWKVMDGVAITSSKARMDFFHDLLRRPDTAGGVQIWFLEINGTPVASEVQVLEREVVYALRSDFDERCGDSSPGTYLQMEILKKLFEAGGYKAYNFGIGVNSYKTRWTEQCEQLVRFRLYNGTLYSRLLCSLEPYDLSRWKELPGLRALNGFFSGDAR
jgi:CelD/BcsL family acetyltransferase involved in cellulose biosynthesis